MEGKKMTTWIYALVRVEMVNGKVVDTERLAWSYVKDSLYPHFVRLNKVAPFGVYFRIRTYEFTAQDEPFILLTAEHIDNVYPATA